MRTTGAFGGIGRSGCEAVEKDNADCESDGGHVPGDPIGWTRSNLVAWTRRYRPLADMDLKGAATYTLHSSRFQ